MHFQRQHLRMISDVNYSVDRAMEYAEFYKYEFTRIFFFGGKLYRTHAEPATCTF